LTITVDCGEVFGESTSQEEAMRMSPKRQPRASTDNLLNPLDDPWGKLKERPGVRILDETRRDPGRT
jgi:hypothetical protein